MLVKKMSKKLEINLKITLTDDDDEYLKIHSEHNVKGESTNDGFRTAILEGISQLTKIYNNKAKDRLIAADREEKK